MIRVPALALAVTAVAGLGLAQPAQAATQDRFQLQTGANACTLSIPTTDTKVRPKASGFRNEGTTYAFVICAFDSPPGSTGLFSELGYVNFILKSMDGADHAVTCTGVNSVLNGDAGGAAAQTYVAKTVTVSETNGPLGTNVLFVPADFGGVSTIPSSGGAFSVTCNLPPQVAVSFMSALSSEDIGT